MKADVYEFLIAELNKILAIICNTNDLLKVDQNELEKRKKECLKVISEERQILKEYEGWIKKILNLDETYNSKRNLWNIMDSNLRKEEKTTDTIYRFIKDMKEPVRIISDTLNDMFDLIEKIKKAEEDHWVQATEKQLREITKLLEKINDHKIESSALLEKAMPETIQVITPDFEAKIGEEAEVETEDDDKLCDKYRSDFERRLMEMQNNAEEVETEKDKHKRGLFRH